MNFNLSVVGSDLLAIRTLSPLVHNITNYVVMEQTANALLAVGASPVMAHALEEVKEMTSLAKSLVLNIGTLSPLWIEAMSLAVKEAQRKAIPVVLDPVGAGATLYRTQTVRALLTSGSITAIRGNASEIASLCKGPQFSTKGVDSALSTLDCVEKAKVLALTEKSVVWMSGAIDVITDGHSTFLVHNGNPLMEKVTGMGCTATAIVGAFLSVNSDPLAACVHAALLMGVVGEMAAELAKGPGSFKTAFLDCLYTITGDVIAQHSRIENL